jgi:hypothetical protein
MTEMASEYYGRRADEQTALGNQASIKKVAAVHYELAYRYNLLSSRAANPSHIGPGGA